MRMLVAPTLCIEFCFLCGCPGPMNPKDSEAVEPGFTQPDESDGRDRDSGLDGNSTANDTEGDRGSEDLASSNNRPPVAQMERELSGRPGTAVELDASESSDPDEGDRLTFAWTQSGGAGVAIRDADRAVASFVPDLTGTYEFIVTVTDPHGASDSASVAVRITAPRDLPVVSTFDDGDEGWRLDGGAFGGPTAPSWSQAERYVHTDGAKFAYWIAPVPFAGDISDAYGTALSFDAAWNDRCCANRPRVVLSGNGLTLNHSPDYDPHPAGDGFWVWLDEGDAWFDANTRMRATGDQVRLVLANVTQLKILAGDSGHSWIDNVVMGATTAAPASSPVLSNFAGGDEDWRLTGGGFGLITRPVHDGVNGMLSVTGARFAAWIAPRKFRGNFSAFLGGQLTFDAAWEDHCCSGQDRIVLSGGGYRLSSPKITSPTDTLANVGVRLDDAAGWTLPDGGRATQDVMFAVLENLQRIRILTGGHDISRLDNVEIGFD